MDWLTKMNSVMDYIESNLTGSISYDAIAQLACCSKYHFQRMFPFITGITLSEYIRRRRLTLAAFDLQTTNDKVIDISIKYGYESPDAFTRAFKIHHGVMPVSARDTDIILKAYPKLYFLITIKGDVEMKYQITQREAHQIFGVCASIETGSENTINEVHQFHKKTYDNLIPKEINTLLGRFHNDSLILASYDYTEKSQKFMLGYFLPKGLPIPDKFTILDIPASTWVVFDVPCGEKPQPMWKRIWAEWFPTAGYESVEYPKLEIYYGLEESKNAFGEIWIPVKEK